MENELLITKEDILGYIELNKLVAEIISNVIMKSLLEIKYMIGMIGSYIMT